MSIAGQRVVIVGDSLSASASAPGQVMGDTLASHGALVRVNARVGRSANNFYAREDVAGQLAQIEAWHPTLAIVVLGTNDIGLSMQVDGQKMAALRDALADAGATVWAFGPPAFADQTRARGAADVVKMMQGVFGPRFIDLRKLTTTTGRTSDGIHFTSAEGKRIGTVMADVFEGKATSSAGLEVAVGLALAVAGWFLFR